MAIKTMNFFVEMQNVNQSDDRTTYRVFTSDEHSIELNFDILDIEDLSGMTAEVMIYTEDKSLFVNKATFKAPNSYSYIMQPQEDARRGLCIVQLLLKDGAKILTSPKYRFEIERSVNDEVVQESGIVNTWESFKKDRETWSKEYQEKLDAWSQEMTEEVNKMKATAERQEARRVEAEELRVRRENVRAGNEFSREQAEKSRSSAEVKRAEAEKLRIEAESKRNNRYESAEAARNSKYDSAEKARESKFNQAEQARADAESKRVTAEQLRASEEAKRASAETARNAAETNRANEETNRVNAEKERESKFSGWDKTMSGVLPEATSTKAGIVKVEGTSGESAPYTVYSRDKFHEIFSSQMSERYQAISTSLALMRSEINNDYQKKLTAGENITIVDNKISGTASYDDTKLREEIRKDYVPKSDFDVKVNDGKRLGIVRTDRLILYNDINGSSSDLVITRSRLAKDLGKKQDKPTDGSKFLTDNDMMFSPYSDNVRRPIIMAEELLITPQPTVPPRQVWTEFNHGSGSGLDADTLDGYHADQFVLKSEQGNSGLKKITGSFVHHKVKTDYNSSHLKLITATGLIIYDFKITLRTSISSEYGEVIGKIDLPQQLPSLASFYMIRPDNDSKFQVNLKSNGELVLATSGYIYPDYPYYANGFIII